MIVRGTLTGVTNLMHVNMLYRAITSQLSRHLPCEPSTAADAYYMYICFLPIVANERFLDPVIAFIGGLFAHAYPVAALRLLIINTMSSFGGLRAPEPSTANHIPARPKWLPMGTYILSYIRQNGSMCNALLSRDMASVSRSLGRSRMMVFVNSGTHTFL
jgi:hypothetical protein